MNFKGKEERWEASRISVINKILHKIQMVWTIGILRIVLP
jgi:hypothetical protein